MIKIYTDSASYIPSDLQIEYNITVLPLSVTIDGKEIFETEISNKTFYKLIRENDEIPTLNSLQPSKIAAAFEKEISVGNTIIGIFISDKISDTYKSACKAKRKLLEKYPRANITIIDSETVAMAQGLAVLSAAEGIKSGAWLEDVVNTINDSLEKTKILFVPHSLKYLEIGGRVGRTKSLLSGALQINPILSSIDGEVGLLEISGTRHKAIDRLLEILQSDIDNYGVEKVIIQHIDALEDAMKLAKKAEQIARTEVSICDIGPVVGCHIGPETLGVVYKTIEKMPKAMAQ